MTIEAFQVYGERCSGTNYIIRLLERNLAHASFTERHGFKHWFVPDEVRIPPDTLVVTVRRNWADWTRSFHRQPWHAAVPLRDLPFGTFLRTRWWCIWDEQWHGLKQDDPRWHREMMHERDPRTGDRFHNVLAMRAAKEENWRAVRARSANAVAAEYDTVACDPEAFVDRLCARFGLARRAHFDPVRTYKGEGNEPFAPKRYAPLLKADADLVARYADPREELAA